MATLDRSLADIVGDDAVVPQDRLGEYAVEGCVPSTAVLPSSVEALSQVLQLATREGWKVTPWGGGTQMGFGNLPRGVDLVLGVERMNRLLAHEPGDLTVTVESGMKLAALQEQIGQQGQFLPLQAPVPTKATIGGILATGASGPSRLAHGTARDWLIGASVVHADGKLTKSGGRVVKNVTGYDLNKLYVGSLGTLGVIVEAAFKVAPLPPRAITLLAGYTSLAAALDAAKAILDQSFTPDALHVLSGNIVGSSPGAESFRGQKAILLVMYAGRASAVAKKGGESEAILRRSGFTVTERVEREEGDALWQGIADLGWTSSSESDVVLKSVLPTSAVPTFVQSALGSGVPWPSPAIAVDPGYGMVRLLWRGNEDASCPPSSIPEVVAILRQEARLLGGHVVVESCPLAAKERIDVWGDGVEGEAVMRRIKMELDPDAILSPGRFLWGI